MRNTNELFNRFYNDKIKNSKFDKYSFDEIRSIIDNSYFKIFQSIEAGDAKDVCLPNFFKLKVNKKTIEKNLIKANELFEENKITQNQFNNIIKLNENYNKRTDI